MALLAAFIAVVALLQFIARVLAPLIVLPVGRLVTASSKSVVEIGAIQPTGEHTRRFDVGTLRARGRRGGRRGG